MEKLKGRVIVCGDIHGAHRALEQCLERSNFDFDNDTLIQLGDICDGQRPYVYEVVETLLKIKNLILIRGNHDDWWIEWLNTGHHPDEWRQGGEATLASYCRNLDKKYMKSWQVPTHFSSRGANLTTDLLPSDIPEAHRNFFESQLPYYKDEKNRLFIHGGFNRHFPLDDKIHNPDYIFWWDRDLWYQVLSFNTEVDQTGAPLYRFRIEENCSEIYIGHTSTTFWNQDKPMTRSVITNMDTGAGGGGRLSFLDTDTKELWQSDPVRDLYSKEETLSR